MAQQNARLNTDLDNKLTSSYYDGTDWYMQTKAKDGAIATLGTTTDAEATGNGTLIGIIKRIRTLFGGGLPSTLSSNGNLKTAISESLPAGTNNIGSINVAQLPSIPAGNNNIGDVDIVSTPADATPGSAHPAKAILVAGSDGTNAQRIKTDANGVVQVQTVQSAQEVTMLASGAKTSSGDTSATPVDVKKFKEAVFFLDVTAASGTTPTLDVKIKTKDPVSGKWFDLVTFTQTTGITSEMKAVSGLIGSQIAVFFTIAGNTPSFTFSLGAVLKS
ncbi:hypothetical protein PQV03_02115 [Thermoanaerobacterium thermosaccharolyticum]|uniref:hypothetical protein n=1 Tax=Thermoanaerobacterium thermosaccharolyticum TaxID=1517 RepID=UPI003D2C1B0D